MNLDPSLVQLFVLEGSSGKMADEEVAGIVIGVLILVVTLIWVGYTLWVHRARLKVVILGWLFRVPNQKQGKRVVGAELAPILKLTKEAAAAQKQTNSSFTL